MSRTSAANESKQILSQGLSKVIKSLVSILSKQLRFSPLCKPDCTVPKGRKKKCELEKTKRMASVICIKISMCVVCVHIYKNQYGYIYSLWHILKYFSCGAGGNICGLLLGRRHWDWEGKDSINITSLVRSSWKLFSYSHYVLVWVTGEALIKNPDW